MFTDWQQALEAEGLPLQPTPADQAAAAARSAARGARGKDDLSFLLDVLGLPHDDDTLTTLYPLLTTTGDNGMTPQTGTTTSANSAKAGTVEQLLAWADDHPAASVRNKAARIRSDLADLTARRAADTAQREAEARIARLKVELEEAQQQLRAARNGSTVIPTAGNASGRSTEELAAIRTWARDNGHQVSDFGKIPNKVMELYTAAHPAAEQEAD